MKTSKKDRSFWLPKRKGFIDTMIHKRSFHMNNVRAIKRIGPHNKDVISVLVGSLLGKAQAVRKSGEGVRISFKKKMKDKEYLFWLHNFLYSRGYASKLEPRKCIRRSLVKNASSFCKPAVRRNRMHVQSISMLSKSMSHSRGSMLNKKAYDLLEETRDLSVPLSFNRTSLQYGKHGKQSFVHSLHPEEKIGLPKDSLIEYEFNTFTFRSFNWVHQLFYKRGMKFISQKITNYITPLTLAVWIMDSGVWNNSGLIIMTNSFTIAEVTFLNDILKNKFQLETHIQSNEIYLAERYRYSISVKKKSISKLIKIIFPYMYKPMQERLREKLFLLERVKR